MGTINCKVNGVIQRGITAAEIDDNGHLLFTLSDGTILDMGYIIGPAGRGITGIQRTSGNGSPGTYDTYTVTFTDGGTFVFQVYNGKDGVSPSVSVSNIPGGRRISITDATGTKNTDVMDGEDGVSPVVTVTQIENGYHLEIDDVTGKKVMNLYNGADGADGANGQDGADGQDGEDGFSPTVAISTIPGGHQVSITDATGTKSFTVMDGEDGEDGASASFAQGTCNTPGATAEKTVSGIAGTVQYGDIISVLFTNANTAASPTLSVGSQSYAILGANLSAVDPDLLTPGIHLFMLYGSQSASAWVLLNGGSGGSYTLPVASQTTLGGVKPSGKTAGEVQPVSVDDNGALWTLPPILDGYCSTTGNTAAKVEQGFVNDAISNGRIIGIYFAHANTAENPTLSVNGKTGPIIGEDTEPISPEVLTAGMHLFVYLERYSGWWMVNSAIADSGGSGGSYTLPVASQNILGGVKAPEKTEAMTQPVGIDISGKLFVLPAEIPIGKCTANGYVVYKTLSTDISRTISNGSLVAVHFSNANTVENPMLTVNGVTGPIIDSSMEAIEPEALTAGMHLFFYVQNEGWWMIKTGQDGQTPNVTIGTVQTLPAGANATAEITGTTPNLALNLGIPKGDPGEQGPKGDTGETGPQGPVGNPTAAQVKAAVEEMVDADPTLLSTVQDGSISEEKLSASLRKTIGVADLDVYGLAETDYTAVDITSQFTPGNFQSWTVTTNTGSGTVLSPVFKTPPKLVIINQNASSISSRDVRFLDGEDPDTAAVATSGIEKHGERFTSDVGKGETKVIYTHEWGRSGCEYMQIRWTNGSFSSWSGKFQVIAYYTDKRPQYVDELASNDGFEHDVEIKWRAAVYGNRNLANATLFAVVPFYPGRKYTMKGGYWQNSLSENISSALLLYDGSVLNLYYPELYDPAWSSLGYLLQPPMRSIIADVTVIESGATNGGKGVVTYQCHNPADTHDYPKWVAFAMTATAKPAVENEQITYAYDDEVIAEWMQARMEEMATGSMAAWRYVTVFDELIDRLGTTVHFVKPYVYHNDSGSHHAAMLSPACPLTGATLTVFGDSIADAYGGHDLASNYFLARICREFGMRLDNRAKGGSNMCISTDAFASVSGVYMLDEMLAEIEAGTILAPGYVLIEFGANCYDTYVGSENDTSETLTKSYYGAFKYFVEKLRSKCPETVFGFILPHDVNWGTNSTSKAAGVPLCREALRTLCAEYRVPYIDMYTDSGITADMLPDGVHISSAQAQNLYYHAIRRFVMGL